MGAKLMKQISEDDPLNFLNRSDPLDEALAEYEQAIDLWKDEALKQVEVERLFEAWEKGRKLAHMRNKASGVMAEALVKCEDEWQQKAIEADKGSVKVQWLKYRMNFCEGKWRTEITKSVNGRDVK